MHATQQIKLRKRCAQISRIWRWADDDAIHSKASVALSAIGCVLLVQQQKSKASRHSFPESILLLVYSCWYAAQESARS